MRGEQLIQKLTKLQMATIHITGAAFVWWRQGWEIYQYCTVLWLWAQTSWQILDNAILLYGLSVVFSWLKRLLKVKWRDFLNLPDRSRCSFSYFYPLIHITDDYLSKNVTGLISCEITNRHPYNNVSVSRYLVKNIVIFTHFITLAAPTP